MPLFLKELRQATAKAVQMLRGARTQRISEPTLRYIKALVFIAALLPLANNAWVVVTGAAIDPVAWMTHASGRWTLIFLLLTLSITPLYRLGSPAWLVRLRRMLGCYAFFYAVLHFSVYLILDHAFDLSAIAHDIVKRPFITVGFAAFVLMAPLALTSTNGWMRRLKRNWQRLHRLVYPIALLGVIHYWWLVKRDHRQPLLYAAILALLLLLRLLRNKHKTRHTAGSSSDL